jgi:threonine/homoserine/homoserine lactone efflux protein
MIAWHNLAPLPAATDPRTSTAMGYLELVVATLVVIPTIVPGYAALAARPGKFVAGAKARRCINKGASAVMAGASVPIIVS